ncbi:hypothetical protein LINPERHAP1_LOCUS30518 [Linum perenne]
MALSILTLAKQLQVVLFVITTEGLSLPLQLIWVSAIS